MFKLITNNFRISQLHPNTCKDLQEVKEEDMSLVQQIADRVGVELAQMLFKTIQKYATTSHLSTREIVWLLFLDKKEVTEWLNLKPIEPNKNLLRTFKMEMMNRQNNPHAWFFENLKRVTGFTDAIEARRTLIYHYSDGKTSSLSELYKAHPKAYAEMRRNTLREMSKGDKELNKARKRLIAVIFDYLNQQGVNEGIEYVKGMACRAAKRESFNDIPLQTLKALYSSLGRKQRRFDNN